jgi:2-desacetyl-2-hydroxyethyl bacteriochlorophyllide A dehydrogenase
VAALLKSKYVVFPEKQQVAVWEEEIAPPGEGEILCKAEKSLISIGTELYCLRGIFEPGTNWFDWVKYPFRPGYSMMGHVIGVGKGVKGLKEGDRVASYGTHQQYYKAKLYDVQKRNDIPEGTGPYILPDEISSEDATWRSLAVTCQNAVRRGDFQFGEMVGVVGLGILGQLVTRFLSAAGARAIVVIDPVKSRLALALQGGATHALQIDVSNAVQPIRQITDGWMLDLVFDVTGHPAVLAPCIPLVRKLGRLVLLGDTPTPSEQHLAPGVVSNSISILGIHGYTLPEKTTPFTPWTADRMSGVYFDYLAAGKISVAELVTHRYSPLQAPEIYQGLLRDRSADVGVIFDWSMLD